VINMAILGSLGSSERTTSIPKAASARAASPSFVSKAGRTRQRRKNNKQTTKGLNGCGEGEMAWQGSWTSSGECLCRSFSPPHALLPLLPSRCVPALAGSAVGAAAQADAQVGPRCCCCCCCCCCLCDFSPHRTEEALTCGLTLVATRSLCGGSARPTKTHSSWSARREPPSMNPHNRWPCLWTGAIKWCNSAMTPQRAELRVCVLPPLTFMLHGR